MKKQVPRVDMEKIKELAENLRVYLAKETSPYISVVIDSDSIRVNEEVAFEDEFYKED